MLLMILKSIMEMIWPYGVAIIAGLAAYLGLRQSGKAAGRAEAEQEQQRAASVDKEKAREVDQEIDAMDDDSVRDRAKRWVRGDGE